MPEASICCGCSLVMFLSRVEGGRHLLPLLWRGSSVTASCPLPVDAGLSALCCSSSGFAVAAPGPWAAEELRVNGKPPSPSRRRAWRALGEVTLLCRPVAAVRGRPTPLGLLAERCGFAVDRRRADVEITAPFAACGVAVEVRSRFGAGVNPTW